MREITIQPGVRRGRVDVPWSKSHLHRLMIAAFLADAPRYYEDLSDGEDLEATRRCLKALASGNPRPLLDCGESGSTLRFLVPLALVLRNEATFAGAGRLPQRPMAPYLDLLRSRGITFQSEAFPLHLRGRLEPGVYSIPGNVSSQFVSGLLFALPLLPGDSRIELTSPLESTGYVEMTLDVLRHFNIIAEKNATGYIIPGGQNYRCTSQATPERDWSSAAFWHTLNSLGSDLQLPEMPQASLQPDKTIVDLLPKLGSQMNLSQCPDLFPPLAIAAAASPGTTIFTGVGRLRFKEADRLAAMAQVLDIYGVKTKVTEEDFTVCGIGPQFRGNVTVPSFNDHRMAMAAAIGATLANGPVTILEPDCVRKSFPHFFTQLGGLSHEIHR